MPKADLEKAKALYPSCSMGVDEWIEFFGSGAGLNAMGRILYDILDETLSSEEREAGQRRIGRRPGRKSMPLSDVMLIARPEEFSNDPLPLSLRKLLRGRSQQVFAQKVPIAQGALAHILNGKRQPSFEMMESLAKAAGVQPWHFPEWRTRYLSQLFAEVFTDKPNLSISAIKEIRTVRKRHDEKKGR